MRALLLYNPKAGKDRDTRGHDIQQVCALLNAHGHSAEAMATTSAQSAGQQVRDAIADGIACIFACGGDGTVHDVLQGMVEEGSLLAQRPLLGIVPMGSANALARHLGLSMNPIEAARQQMSFAPREIPVGQIECDGKRRYFIAMAGAGPAGLLVYKMTGSKGRIGRTAYYVRAWTLFASRAFPPFHLEFTEIGQSESRTMRAVSAMAVRVGDLGGLFSRLTGEAQIHHPHLQLIAVRPPAWLSLPLWFVMAWLRMSRCNPLLHIANVDSFTCEAAPGDQVHLQADGEWIGTAPMRVTLLPNAVRLLMPRVTA